MHKHEQEQMKNTFQEDGYILCPSIIDSKQVEEIKKLYEKQWVKLVADGEISRRKKRPIESLYPRMRDYHRKEELIHKWIFDNPTFFEILELLIGEEVLLISTSYYFKSPTTRGLPLHQDNYAFGVDPGTTYAIWISLDDSDRENGGMFFVPGSHRLQLIKPDLKTQDVKQHFSDKGQEIKAIDKGIYKDVSTSSGDILIFDGNVLHGSHENSSHSRFRESFLLHFMPSSAEKITLNYNYLIDKRGKRIRKRLNTSPKIAEGQKSIFSVKEADYFADWK